MASISETDSEATIEFLGESFTGSTEEYGVDITITRVSNGQITPMSVNMKSLLRDVFVEYCQLNNVLEEALERCAFWFENAVMDLDLTVEDHLERGRRNFFFGMLMEHACRVVVTIQWGVITHSFFPLRTVTMQDLLDGFCRLANVHHDTQERSMLHSDNCYNDSAWENLKDRGLFSIGLDESVIMVLGYLSQWAGSVMLKIRSPQGSSLKVL